MDNPFEKYANSFDCEMGIAMSKVAPDAVRATNCVITFEDGTQMDIGDARLLRVGDDGRREEEVRDDTQELMERFGVDTVEELYKRLGATLDGTYPEDSDG